MTRRTFGKVFGFRSVLLFDMQARFRGQKKVGAIQVETAVVQDILRSRLRGFDSETGLADPGVDFTLRGHAHIQPDAVRHRAHQPPPGLVRAPRIAAIFHLNLAPDGFIHRPVDGLRAHVARKPVQSVQDLFTNALQQLAGIGLRHQAHY